MYLCYWTQCRQTWFFLHVCLWVGGGATGHNIHQDNTLHIPRSSLHDLTHGKCSSELFSVEKLHDATRLAVSFFLSTKMMPCTFLPLASASADCGLPQQEQSWRLACAAYTGIPLAQWPAVLRSRAWCPYSCSSLWMFPTASSWHTKNSVTAHCM